MATWLSRLRRALGLEDASPIPERGVAPPVAQPADEREWPHWPRGSLPNSLKLRDVSLYRYQPKRYLELGATWYRMFWDVDRKWNAENRYSAQDISPGHYFSVSAVGASAEMNAYGANIEDYELLRFEMSIDNLLNLTDRTSITWFYNKHFQGDKNWHWAIILNALVNQKKGGSAFNAFAGHKALLDGYDGIVFFGARALTSIWPDAGSMVFVDGWTGDRDLNLVDFDYLDMRDDPACINVVIYFGHNVVRSTRRFYINDMIIRNDLFAASNATIDTVFSNDPNRLSEEDLTYENLRHRVDRIGWVGKTGIIYKRD
jgi:hypothetical protein